MSSELRKSQINVAAIQQACSSDKAASLATTEKLVREAVASGANLVILQELHATLYFCQTEETSVFELAEPIPGPTSKRLSDLARELGIVLVGSIFERRMNGVYHNTAVVFEKDGSLAGLYRKMHIPDDPGFYEKFYFTPGDAQFNDGRSGFTPIDTSVGRLGVLVCWDQWYPEAARLMALAGAEVILLPTNFPPGAECMAEFVINARAMENAVFYAGINRVGTERGFRFIGKRNRGCTWRTG